MFAANGRGAASRFVSQWTCQLEEMFMRTLESSLRALVDKWFAPTLATPIRVTRCSHKRTDGKRYVRVETERQGGTVALFFFLHSDGTWQVFPPRDERLTIRPY
jgi:hypothetical protein